MAKVGYTYPTTCPVVNDLCKFFYERLPAAICKPIPAYGEKPSLAEDWWVEKKIQGGVVVPGVNDNEQGLRNIYRWGRYVAIEKGEKIKQKLIQIQKAEKVVQTLKMEYKELLTDIALEA